MNGVLDDLNHTTTSCFEKTNTAGKKNPVLVLTDDQKQAVEGIIKFLNSPVTTDQSSYACSLTGSAGTGKTTIARNIMEYAMGNNIRVLGVAPTHKACGVLRSSLQTGRFLTIDVITVASLLNKTMSHGFVGSKNFKSAGGFKGVGIQLLLIDEASMLSDRDTKQIMDHIQEAATKAIFIGDPAQLPNPSQPYTRAKSADFKSTTSTCSTKSTEVLVKRDSMIFDLKINYHLTKVMRQDDDNPVINIYDLLRNNLNSQKVNLPHDSQFNSNGDGYRITNSSDRFEQWIKESFKGKPGPDTCRLITYTNQAVRDYNTQIRHQLGLKKRFYKGEWLMGYSNIGYPKPKIKNGTDYKILKVVKTKSHSASSRKHQYNGLCGWVVTVTSVPGSQIMTDLFFLDLNANPNIEVLDELMHLAELNNRKGSSKKDYMLYRKLKEQMVFLDDVYKINDQVITGDMLKEEHPLLTTNVNVVIQDEEGERVIKNNRRSQKIRDLYPDFLEERAEDAKMLGGQESLIDKYRVLTKDLDYSYAITVHKSQGSTISHVLLDETDIDKISDRWNYSYNLPENKSKERNQLKYVAYTRAAQTVAVLANRAPPKPCCKLRLRATLE